MPNNESENKEPESEKSNKNKQPIPKKETDPPVDKKKKEEPEANPYKPLMGGTRIRNISSNFKNIYIDKKLFNDQKYFIDWNAMLPSFDDNQLNIYTDTLFQSTNKLEQEINNLKTDQQSLVEKLKTEKKSSEESQLLVAKLKQNETELQRRLNLGSLLSQVNDEARKKLFESDDFLQLFETSKNCNSFVLSIDIRRSTELMLKAKRPELFERFIVTLCDQLSTVILNNYGVFDKFTGDGVLAFFPDFFSGPDAGLLAIKTAIECHEIFKHHYKQNRNCFVSVLQDIGLGIGIDYGQTYLVKMSGSFTVIGSPVVYACRMSGANAGDTLLNQTAYEHIFSQYRQNFSVFETSLHIKNEGDTLAYKVISNGSSLSEYKRPNWDETIKQNKAG